MSHQPKTEEAVLASLDRATTQLSKLQLSEKSPEIFIRDNIKKCGRLFVDLSTTLISKYKKLGIIEGHASNATEKEELAKLLPLKQALVKNIEWLFVLICISIQKRIPEKRKDNRQAVSKRSVKLHKRITKRLSSLDTLTNVHKNLSRTVSQHNTIKEYDQTQCEQTMKTAQACCYTKGNVALDDEIEGTKIGFKKAEIALWVATAASTAGTLAITITLTAIGSISHGVFSLAAFSSHASLSLQVLLPLFLVAVCGFLLAPVVRRERFKSARDRFSFLAKNKELLNELKDPFDSNDDSSQYHPESSDDSDDDNAFDNSNFKSSNNSDGPADVEKPGPG